jgi:hypothetical protein
LAFEQLEPMDLPLYLTQTPLVGESGEDGCVVASDTFGKGPEFWHSARGRFC